MFKKLGLFLRFLVIAAVWSAFWLFLTQQLVLRIWNFNYISPKQWSLIKAFWDKNGVIREASDYMLFITLLVILIVWYIGFKKLYHTNYVKLFLRPFEYFHKKRIEQYTTESKHVVIKNLVVGEKMTLEDLINEKIKEEKGQKASHKESEILRETISKKIIEQKGK